MKNVLTGAFVSLLCIPPASFAGGVEASSSSIIPYSAIYVGLGAGYNIVNLSQEPFASGVSDVYLGSTLVASGQAGGPAPPFDDNKVAFSPEIQLGYFRRINQSQLLWGAKLLYQYLNTRLINDNFSDLQVGTFTNSSGVSTVFTGHVTVNSMQTSVNHELGLLAYVGRSFHHLLIYAGGGPAMFATKTAVYNATGYADINGVHADITGDTVNFSSAKWFWGGMAQIGLSYFLNPSWSVDVNYTYAISGQYKTSYSSPFTSLTQGYTTVGTLYIDTTQQIITNSLMVSVNMDVAM